ncbi:MAG: HD domain-containing protein [Chordicoccus sp.]
MNIDRTRVTHAFDEYTSHYNLADPKVKLKYDHTYRVADIADDIARSLSMSSEDVDLAWLLGMLHDIGRFEQVRRYGTFQDGQSVNHAALSADILFGRPGAARAGAGAGTAPENSGACAAPAGEAGSDHEEHLIRRFLDDPTEDRLIEKAVRLHNVYHLPENLTEREYRFATILRDADKVDILRVNCETPRSEIYDIPEEEFRTSSITDEVLNEILRCENVDRRNSRTPVDYIIGHIGFVFGIVYPESFRLIRKQGYLDEMMDYKTTNPDTAEKFKLIRKCVNAYIDGKCRV